MAQRLTIQPHNTIEELTYEIKTTRDGRYRLRVQTILLSLQKMRTVDIVKQLLIGRHSVSIWIKLYNQHGLDGLKNFSLGGRREGDVKWSNEIFTALFEKLDSMDEFYSVPKMQSWIEDTYGVTIPQNTIHNRLRAGGYTFKSSRPNPYKGNPNLQASFKKTV